MNWVSVGGRSATALIALVGVCGCAVAPPPPSLAVNTQRAKECEQGSVSPERQIHVEKRAPVMRAPSPPRQAKTRARGVAADYAIRVGIGFRSSELPTLQRAVDAWVNATGLPLHLRHGYGPMGNFHIAEEIPVCGQRWVYDGFLGCYHPEADLVVLNRHGIALEQKDDADLLYIVLLHEIGHWLGLAHAEDGEDSIMLPDYPRLAERQGDFSGLSQRDVERVCELNRCSREKAGGAPGDASWD